MKFLIFCPLILLFLFGCHKSSGNNNDDSDASDSEADTGTGADADPDTDTDTDTDSDTDTDTDTELSLGEVGYRCDVAGECLPELECRSDFFKERPVCTMSCSSEKVCPDDIECVEEIPDFNGNVVGPYCLRPCEQQEDCGTSLSSECDSHDLLEKKYCF